MFRCRCRRHLNIKMLCRPVTSVMQQRQDHHVSVLTMAKTMATKKGALRLFNFATCKLELPQFHIIPWAPDGTCKTEQDLDANPRVDWKTNW